MVSVVQGPRVFVTLFSADVFDMIMKKCLEEFAKCGYFTDEDINEVVYEITEWVGDDWAESIRQSFVEHLMLMLKRHELKLVEFPSEDVTVYTILPEYVNAESVLEYLLMVRGDDETFKNFVMAALVNHLAGGLDFEDEEKQGDVALVVWNLMELLGVEPDEVVDMYDYWRSYTGPVYWRIGKLWICCTWSYANYTRDGEYVGVQKGRVYSIESPSERDEV